MKHVAIIGNGIAGITAARFIRKKSDYHITVISAEAKHFFSRTALMYVYMGHMQFQDIKPYEDYFWDKNQINLIQAYVQKVEPNLNRIQLSNGKNIHYDELILATGSRYNKFGWPGQDLEGVNGLYSLQDLEYLESYTKNITSAAVVGGGLIGIELAEMLLSRGIKVYFLVREKNYWDNVLPIEEAKIINRHLKEHHINLLLDTELEEILSDENSRARAILTSKGDEIPVQFVGLTAGVQPNIRFLEESGIALDKGVLVDQLLRTNIKNIYAIGDCAQLKNPMSGRKPIEAVWYTGKIMGKTVADTICGMPKQYNPGIWFNSAKFLDIEYQVYGEIPPELPDGTSTVYWEHPEGKKSIRINYNTETQAVTGFNLMGVRYRHRICEKMIREKWPIREVLQNLSAANFDPEFFPRYEKDVIESYKKQHPDSKLNLAPLKKARAALKVKTI